MFTLLPRIGHTRDPLAERATPRPARTSPAFRAAVGRARGFRPPVVTTEPSPQARPVVREVVGQAEIQIEDRTTIARTLYASERMLEVYSKSRLPVRAEVQARLMGESEDWSHGVISKCVETIGGWKVEMLFDSTAPGGAC